MESGGPVRPAQPLGRRLARLALLAAGVGLVVWMFRTVGWPAIEANLRAIGGWFFLARGDLRGCRRRPSSSAGGR